MKKIFLYITCFAPLLLIAQPKQTIIGVIKDSITQEHIAFAAIINVNNKKTSLSNQKGIFSIQAMPNHLLSVASSGYSFDTIRITEDIFLKDTLQIFLKPLTNTLEKVIVYTKVKYNPYQLDSINRRKDFFKIMTDHTIPTFSLANSGAGLGINLDHFYGYQKKKRKSISLFDKMEDEQYINYRFNASLVHQLTDFTDDKLISFMQLYRPDYKWLRKHTNKEDILFYINDKLKLFDKK